MKKMISKKVLAAVLAGVMSLGFGAARLMQQIGER